LAGGDAGLQRAVASLLCSVTQQVGPPGPGALQSLLAAPLRNAPMISTDEHIGNLPAAEISGAGVVRLLQETLVAKALRLRRLGVSDDARQQPHDPFDDRKSGGLTSEQHEIPE